MNAALVDALKLAERQAADAKRLQDRLSRATLLLLQSIGIEACELVDRMKPYVSADFPLSASRGYQTDYYERPYVSFRAGYSGCSLSVLDRQPLGDGDWDCILKIEGLKLNPELPTTGDDEILRYRIDRDWNCTSLDVIAPLLRIDTWPISHELTGQTVFSIRKFVETVFTALLKTNHGLASV